jgi:hypothetical protein
MDKYLTSLYALAEEAKEIGDNNIRIVILALIGAIKTETTYDLAGIVQKEYVSPMFAQANN